MYRHCPNKVLFQKEWGQVR